MAADSAALAAPTARADIAEAPGGTFGNLVRFAAANIRRRPERFILSVLGIALALACVTVVRTISSSSAITGAETVTEVLEGAQAWAIPAEGVHFDRSAQTLVADGAPPSLNLPEGWQATSTIAGAITVDEVRVGLRGQDDIPAGTARMSSGIASKLGVADGGTITIGAEQLAVQTTESGSAIYVNTALAEEVVGNVGWVTLVAPVDDRDRKDLAELLSETTGLDATTDPSITPDASGKGLIYDAVGGSSAVTFEQKYSALFAGQVTTSTLGLISVIGLILGFIIAVSSFLAAVQERRREFGIMASIGLADEVLYFFLVESGIVFLLSFVVGAAGAGIAVALVIPEIATMTAWLQAVGTVAAFLPAMAIVGALVPVHRLLQQRPVDLLGDQ